MTWLCSPTAVTVSVAGPDRTMMTTADPSPARHVALEEFLAADPQTFGERYEIVDGLVVHAMAQSPAHDRVVRRLADALERAIDPDGPCREVNSDTAVRLVD